VWDRRRDPFLSVHEAGHAVTRGVGRRTGRSQGRVTLNPLAHIDPVGTVLLPVLLALAHAPIFGYASLCLLCRYAAASPAGAHPDLDCRSGPRTCSWRRVVNVAFGSGLRIAGSAPQASVLRLASFDPTMPVSASGFVMASYFGLACTFLRLSFFINVVLALFNFYPYRRWTGVGTGALVSSVAWSVLRRGEALRVPDFIVALYSNVFDYLDVPISVVLAADSHFSRPRRDGDRTGVSLQSRARGSMGRPSECRAVAQQGVNTRNAPERFLWWTESWQCARRPPTGPLRAVRR